MRQSRPTAKAERVASVALLQKSIYAHASSTSARSNEEDFTCRTKLPRSISNEQNNRIVSGSQVTATDKFQTSQTDTDSRSKTQLHPRRNRKPPPPPHHFVYVYLFVMYLLFSVSVVLSVVDSCYCSSPSSSSQVPGRQAPGTWTQVIPLETLLLVWISLFSCACMFLFINCILLFHYSVIPLETPPRSSASPPLLRQPLPSNSSLSCCCIPLQIPPLLVASSLFKLLPFCTEHRPATFRGAVRTIAYVMQWTK